jgi:hypothetical protein
MLGFPVLPASGDTELFPGLRQRGFILIENSNNIPAKFANDLQMPCAHAAGSEHRNFHDCCS